MTESGLTLTPKENKKLEKLFSVLGKKTISEEDFVKAFGTVIQIVKDTQRTNLLEFEGMQKALDILGKKLKDEKDVDVSDIKRQVELAVGQALREQENGMNFIRDKVRNLKTLDPLAITEEVLAQVPAQKLYTAEEVRDLLEQLVGEERLDARAIRNLPEFTKAITRGVLTASALYSLADVDVAGIIIGQSIKWDGIRWIPYTPASSGGTSVYNEVVAGSTKTFTLAHTPVAGTERVFANGQRLTPTVDYTIVSAVITTVLSWSAGMITADYNF